MILIQNLLFCAIVCMASSIDVRKLIADMTLEEKISLVHGHPQGEYVGNVPANNRLGIPALKLNDGPQGFRGKPGTSTCWPSGLTIAATWDTHAAGLWGQAMGKEFFDKGANVQLGPGLCLARIPNCGRNFEYLSGEDPMLGYFMVKPVVGGIQQNNVIANAKHYINNNQETDRMLVSAHVDEALEFDMYLRPFEGAIEAGVGSIMCSYNRINNTWSCENNQTLNLYLRSKLNFTGWVMSDWTATHSIAITKGLDQEMPGGFFYAEPLLAAVKSGKIPTSDLDQSVYRILSKMDEFGLFTHQTNASRDTDTNSPYNMALARNLSAQSHVLLKNSKNLLPLSGSKSIIVIGAAGNKSVVAHGGGSGEVQPKYIISPWQGISEAAASKVDYDDGSDLQRAQNGAKSHDIAIICVATTSSEGSDRSTLALGQGQDELIEAIAQVQANSIVVMTVPGATLTPWRDNVSAILTNFMPGQEAGHALADVLFGHVNPSGRLPLTFPIGENDQGFTKQQWPGTEFDTQTTYSEGVFFGYRWYQQHNVNPAFWFGHGLSYTSFTYSNLSQIDDRNFQFNLCNTGKRYGSEVIQAYLGFPESAHMPPRQLRRFEKLTLDVNNCELVGIEFNDRDFSLWDVDAFDWKLVTGNFTLDIGASVGDIRLTTHFQVTQ